ncbi:MAG: transposase [Candidatus Omnitrophica bacterium]|nr:transposase [Candidatus Omnitrophota bacterium]MBU1922838.1 transposase [Candidatus Omnitrophota bacterium]
MPRPSRLIIDNSIHHVIARGNQKQITFIDECDFLRYLDLLKHYKHKYRFELYGYCLMPNHIHLIIKVLLGKDLQKIMQGLNQTYTIWFNEKYNKAGHLWQGRYKDMLVQEDKYLLDCITYVEFNPARANLVKSPAEYRWCSWNSRFGIKQDHLINQFDVFER